jgi:hypothetical protein
MGLPEESNDNRPSQKSYTFGKFTGKSVIERVRNAVPDFLIQHPTTPANRLAEIMLEEADKIDLAELQYFLAHRLYTKIIRAERRKQVAAEQYSLPGFEHIPASIPIPKGGQKPLADANRWNLREYLAAVMAEHRQRRNTDPRIQELKALLKIMAKYTPTNHSITVRQVMLLEQQG